MPLASAAQILTAKRSAKQETATDGPATKANASDNAEETHATSERSGSS